jgi:TPR repeat protein
MPSIRLILTALSLLLLSVWGVLLVLEKTVSWQFYLFLFGVVVVTPIVFKAVWDSWRDIQELRVKARKGDRDAMYWLAHALRETDMNGAMHWAEEGAALGHRDSNFLAGYLRYGSGIRDQQTFDYFLAAAEKDSEPAMRAVADCYKLGHCVLPNDRLSFEWRFKSASNWGADFQSRYFVEPDKAPGYVCSRYAVGMSYLRGEGCDKNEIEGYAWLLLAARARHTGAINKVRELDRRKAFKLRAQMQDRSLEITKALEMGVESVPIAATGTTVVSEAKPASVRQAVDDSDYPEDAPEPVSAWRAFFTVFLSGNLLMAFLLIGAKSSDGSPIRPEVNGALYAGFIVAAVMAALYGRKLHPAFNLLLMAVTSVAASAALAFWGLSSMVGFAIGASLAAGSLVIPGSVILIHWRHPVSTFLFYVLIFIHSIAVMSVMLS